MSASPNMSGPSSSAYSAALAMLSNNSVSGNYIKKSYEGRSVDDMVGAMSYLKNDSSKSKFSDYFGPTQRMYTPLRENIKSIYGSLSSHYKN